MLTGRRCGGTSEISAPSSRIEPLSGLSSPASMRSSVVLPQPDGPSSAKNSPALISSDRSSTAGKAPKRVVIAKGRAEIASRPGGAEHELDPRAICAGRAHRLWQIKERKTAAGLEDQLIKRGEIATRERHAGGPGLRLLIERRQRVHRLF